MNDNLQAMRDRVAFLNRKRDFKRLDISALRIATITRMKAADMEIDVLDMLNTLEDLLVRRSIRNALQLQKK